MEAVADEVLALSRDLSPVLRALRFTGDEVQLGRVLAAVCQEPAVAQMFLRAVGDAAVGGHRQAAARVTSVPADVTCVDERVVRARVGRQVLRQRYKDVGRVDLDFASPSGWRMLVELKLGSGFGPKQLERYSTELPVAAVVRSASSVPHDMAKVRNWVGAVTWSSIRGALRELPLDGAARDQWLALLDVIEHDGDFDGSKRPTPPEVEEAHMLLQAIADDVVAGFAAELRRAHGSDAEAFVEQLRVRRLSAGTGPWAGFGITTEEGDWSWIALRNLWTRAPRLRVWFYDYADSWAKYRGNGAYELIETEHGFERMTNDSWRWENPVPVLAAGDPGTLRETIQSRLSALVAAGCFSVAVRRSRKSGR